MARLILAENFVQRLYVYNSWRQEEPWRAPGRLVDFHSRQKYLLMMHDYNAYKRLGRLVADLGEPDRLERIGHSYLTELMTALAKVPGRGQRVNVLQHVMGYFKRQLNDREKASLVRSIEQYQAREVPFIVPVALLKHYAHLYGKDHPYLMRQTFLDPYPEALGLRNPI